MDNQILFPIIAFAIIMLLLLLVRINRKTSTPKESPNFPYQIQNSLLTAAERSFYGALTLASKERAVIFSKVRIADVLKVTKGMNASDSTSAFNRISSKHFDFVLCTPSDLTILCVIELDDSSHNSKKAQTKDKFKSDVCGAAGLKLHRFTAKQNYSIPSIIDVIWPADETSNERGATNLTTPNNPTNEMETKEHDQESEVCPKCGSLLVTREAKRGKNSGSMFRACSAFPKCRFTQPRE